MSETSSAGDIREVNVDSTSGSIGSKRKARGRLDVDTTSGGTEVECTKTGALKEKDFRRFRFGRRRDRIAGRKRLHAQIRYGLRFTGQRLFAMRNNTYGDGRIEIKVDTVSGALRLQQG